jgi:hypothetical protein
MDDVSTSVETIKVMKFAQWFGDQWRMVANDQR